jgi:threonine dehydratase
MLDEDDRRRGVVAATRGNHGQGVAYAGRALGIPVTIVVPVGNNPEKNAAMRGLGAEVIEEGRDYDSCFETVQRLVAERGLTLVHGTNNRNVLAGAGTLTLEVVEQAPQLDAMVIAVGGGSQAVGALTVLRALRGGADVYGAQAAGAPAIYEGWRTHTPTTLETADTFADGVATRSTYEMTFPALCDGLAGFATVTDAEIADALRLLLATTHNLVEGAGAVGLAGLIKLGSRLAGKTVAVIISGGNIDRETLWKVVSGEV